MNAKEFLEAGQLTNAVDAAIKDVKANPADVAKRSFLSELACFTDNLERADKQLDVLETQDPKSAIGVSLFRQLIRGEQARREFYSEGRVPGFLDQPTEAQKLGLQASIEIREGRLEDASKLLSQAEEARPKLQGTCDGEPFDDFRDLDDLLLSSIEVLTSTGKYFWIPIERIESMEFNPPQFPRDLLWARVHVVVSDGPDGEVYLPTLYAESYLDEDDRVRLGRVTDWRGEEGQPVRGFGQRTFLVGEEAKPILELKTIEFKQD